MLAAATALFTSCSSDNNNDLVPGNGTDTDGSRFLTVKIAPTVDSRAESDFDNGTAAESEAKTALFAFFDENGNMSQTPQTANLSWQTETPTDQPTSNKVSNVTVVIAGQIAPSKMLVVLNPGNLVLSGKTLQACLDLTGNYSSATSGTFVMTNSSYFDDGIITATDIAEQTYATREDAEKNPVQICVERVVAKVQTSKDQNFVAKSTDVEVVNGSTLKLTPEIQGIEIANVVNKAFLFKNIEGIENWKITWPGVNSVDEQRSYWATTAQNVDFLNQSWNDITDKFDVNQAYYIQPNTNSTKTAVLVKAVLKDENDASVDLVQWSGNYYKKEEFKSTLATFLNNEGYKIVVSGTATEPTELRNFLASDMDYVLGNSHATLVKSGKINAYQTVGRVIDIDKLTITKENIATTDGEENPRTYSAVTTAEIENYMCDNHHKLNLWEGGKAYFYTNIIHHEGHGDTFKYGVIRNHIYNLNLTSIEGLGVPVVNPEETIIPESPKDILYYLGAQVRILKWRLVPTQNVEFNN